MRIYSLRGKKIQFTLTSDKKEVNYGESFTVTLKATGADAKPGLEIPYSISSDRFLLPSKDMWGNPLPVLTDSGPEDFIKGGSLVGLFKLNSNLESKITFRHNSKIYEQGYTDDNKRFSLSLLFTSKSISVWFNKIPGEDPNNRERPYEPRERIPTVDLIALATQVEEGGVAEFKIIYKDFEPNIQIRFLIEDSGLEGITEDSYITTTGPSGEYDIKYPVPSLEDKNSARIISTSLVEYGRKVTMQVKSVFTPVDNSKTLVIASDVNKSYIVKEEYYKKFGDQKRAEKIIIEVSAGAYVISDTTSKPSIDFGSDWIAGTTFEIHNKGHIYGRGGDGGVSSYYEDLAGGDGGTAIRSKVFEVGVLNSGVIAGGGGGSGSAWVLSHSVGGSFTITIEKGISGNGGQPLGRGGPKPSKTIATNKHLYEGRDATRNNPIKSSYSADKGMKDCTVTGGALGEGGELIGGGFASGRTGMSEKRTANGVAGLLAEGKVKITSIMGGKTYGVIKA